MKVIENDYVMSIKSSNQQRWVWCVLNAILQAMLSIILIRLSWAVPVVMCVFIVSYLATTLMIFGGKRFNYQLIINERGQLQYKSLVKLNGDLLASSFSTNWFVWLNADMTFGNRNGKFIKILIWRDSLDEQSFRRLARIIRLKRQMI